MITHSTKFLRISCVSALLLCACISYGQLPSSRAFATDAELVALANKYVHTPVQKIEKVNGDVFFQRNLSAYLHASQPAAPQPAAGGTDFGHDHNDTLLEKFLNRPHPSVATIKKYFSEAANEFKVPVEILMAVGQVQSNWAQVSESMYGSWGIMGIIENPYIHQISIASSLLHIPAQQIKEDARTNIRAAAVLLSYYQKNKPGVSLDDWFEAVRQLTGLTDEKMKTELAVRIYELMKSGSKTVTLWGEVIYVPPVTNKKILEDVVLPATPTTTSRIMAVDYPNAVAGFSTCPTNYGTRPPGSVINFYFVHYIALGTYQGTLSWFSNCASGVSAHYVVRNSDGQITQVVAEADRAFSQGVSLYNNEGIGVEHEVLVANLTMWDSKPMLAAAGSLGANVCNRNAIPKVRRAVNGDRGIYGHSDVRATDCPNLTPGRWDTLINRIATTTTIVNNQSIAIPVLYSIENPGAGTQLTATWKASTDANLVGYRLYYATNDALTGWALAANESTLTAATTSVTLTQAQFTVPPAGNAYHFKLVSVVSNGANPNLESASSDIYSRSNNVAGSRVLIVDGFDRSNGSYTGATHPFVARYFNALRDKGLVQVSSVANEKVEDGTFVLTNYDIVVWFVGDESSVNVVFSASEKTAIKTFLNNGGKLMASGSEIAYNLGRTDAAAIDLDFMNNYLKATYVGDGGAGYSPATGIAGTDFAGLNIPFGVVYAEDFPDDVAAVSGATNILNYAVANKRGGVAYKGSFGSGTTTPGAVIYLPWTLETATDAGMAAFTEKTLQYFDVAPVPVAPTAVADVALTQTGAAKYINVLANDIANGGSLVPSSVTISAAAANGTVSIQPNGDMVYTSNSGFTGTDNFQYTIQNTTGALLSNAATVTVTVVAAITCNPTAPESDDIFPKRDLRGAWVSTVSNIDWPSSRTLTTAQQQAELLKILDTLSNMGINTVYLQIRPESDALYASTIDPWSYWLTNAQGTPPNPVWDPLQFAVEQAHARGMELHAWINPYRAKQSTPTLAPNHVATLHPDWTFLSGTVTFVTLLNPGLPAVRKYLTNVIADIANRYDVDGIHFDDYFYPYAGMTGQDTATYTANNPTGIATIQDWRRNNINLLIANVYDTLQQINILGNRNIVFGVSPFGIWKSGTPPGITGTSSYNDVFCDPIAWLQAGKVDYLAPQLYWKVTGPQDYLALSKWWNDQAVIYNRHIYPGLALYKMSDVNNWEPGEILSQININHSSTHGQVLGQVMFSTRQIMTNVKNIKNILQTGLYRYKSFAPPMPWKESVCPNNPLNIRIEADSVKWDTPPAAIDGDLPVKYVVYQYASIAESISNYHDSKKILGIVAGNKFTLPASVPRSGYIVVTALDKNNNESEKSNVSLPLSLISFQASKYNANVLVTWNTENEQNVATFNVERSDDGFRFAPIGTVTARNQIRNAYTYTDRLSQLPVQPNRYLYYRLKTIDVDGKVTYSAIARITLNDNTQVITISPNPFTNYLYIYTSAVVKRVTLYDMAGKQVFGTNVISGNKVIIGKPLARGSYVIKIETADGTDIRKLYKSE